MKVRSLLAIVFLALFARPLESQNRRLPPVTLPDGPVFYNTIDQPRIRVVVLTEGLSHPWGMAFLPNGDMLVTEREGRLRVIRDGVLDPDPIPGVPQVYNETRFTRLMDIALHPQFVDNNFVYLTYTKPLDDSVPGQGRGTVALARGRFDGSALRDMRDIFVADPWGGAVAGSRIVFAPDGTIYMTMGGAFGGRRAVAVGQ